MITNRETTQPRESSLSGSSTAAPVRTAILLALFAAQAATFAAAAGSGKIPAVVLNLFRALLTL